MDCLRNFFLNEKRIKAFNDFLFSKNKKKKQKIILPGSKYCHNPLIQDDLV